MAAPNPGQTSKSDFKAAGPIDADRVGIVGLPLAPLPQDLIGKPGIARQPVCLRQGDEVLVAIKLPRDLAVTGLVEIQITHLVEQSLRSSFSVDRIDVPVNRAAVVEILITHQVEAMPADLLRLLDDLFDLAGKPL